MRQLQDRLQIFDPGFWQLASLAHHSAFSLSHLFSSAKGEAAGCQLFKSLKFSFH
jgi:hypothetical protein